VAEGDRPLSGRLRIVVLAAVALALADASSAVAAVSVTFDGRILRYRSDGDGSAFLDLRRDRSPPLLTVRHSPAPASAGFGCGEPVLDNPERSEFVLGCPFAVPQRDLFYRFSLGDGSGNVLVNRRMGGVIFAGAGDDTAQFGDRVFGGPGDDFLSGTTVFGGPGDDRLEDLPDRLRTPGGIDFGTLRGGVGDDRVQTLDGSEQLFGGPGDDKLLAEGARETVVGGSGRDVVTVVPDGGAPDVVRLRGGGRDLLVCLFGALGASDRIHVDRRDGIDPVCGNVERP
jgi:hypothetical protein